MVGGGQSARSRADDQDALAGAGSRWFQHPAPLASKVTEEPLHRMNRHRAVEMGTVADGFTRVITHPSVDRGKRIVRNELTPRLLVPAGGRMGKPGLNVFPGRATGIAGRQQIDVDGSTLAHRPGPGLPMRQVCKGREVMQLRCGRAPTGIPAGVLVTSHFPSIGSAGQPAAGFSRMSDHRSTWPFSTAGHADHLCALSGARRRVNCDRIAPVVDRPDRADAEDPGRCSWVGSNDVNRWMVPRPGDAKQHSNGNDQPGNRTVVPGIS